MGVHRKRSAKRLRHYPPIPKSKGKRRRLISQHGHVRYFKIEDEISRLQRGGKKNKVIVFQKLRFEHNNQQVFRLGYYMLGVKKGARGRWVWGQYCLLIPKRDLRALIRKAKKKRWF